MPEEMSIRCPLKVSGRREYMEDLPRDKNKRGEKKKTWNKKTKRVLCEEFYEEIWKCILRKIKVTFLAAARFARSIRTSGVIYYQSNAKVCYVCSS